MRASEMSTFDGEVSGINHCREHSFRKMGLVRLNEQGKNKPISLWRYVREGIYLQFLDYLSERAFLSRTIILNWKNEPDQRILC